MIPLKALHLKPTRLRQGHARRFNKIVSVLLPVLALAACTTNPATGKLGLMPLMSEEQEAAIGAQQHPQIVQEYGGIYSDQKIGTYVSEITGRLMKAAGEEGQPYQATVLNSPVINAFALPGGYVYVTRGLMALANSEAELAAVMGHEIGHVQARHSSQRQTAALGTNILGAVLAAVINQPGVGDLLGLGGQGVVAGYSRGQELEADELGVRYLTAAGYTPYAEAAILGSLGAQSSLHAKINQASYDPNTVGWFDSHPATNQRVSDALEDAQATGMSRDQGEVGKDIYLSKIDGMIYGDTPEQGIVRGRNFIHPDLRFAFSVPEGFTLNNSPSAVYAVGPNKIRIQFDGARNATGAGAAAYLRNDWARGTQLGYLEEFTVNGLPAASAVAQVQNGYVQLAVVKLPGNQVYRFVMMAPVQIFEQGMQAMSATVSSFKTISAAEARKVKPLRIKTVTVAKGQTAQSLAKQMAFDDHQLDRFYVLNGLQSGATLKAGQKVKLVVD